MTEYSNVTGADLKNKDCNQVVLGSYMIAVFVRYYFCCCIPDGILTLISW